MIAKGMQVMILFPFTMHHAGEQPFEVPAGITATVTRVDEFLFNADWQGKVLLLGVYDVGKWQILYSLRDCTSCGQSVSTTKQEGLCTVCGGEDMSLTYINQLNGLGTATHWAGCNYHVGRGTVECEPIGTAQSMHDCDGCSNKEICTLKMDTPTWVHTQEITDQLNEKWAAHRKADPSWR